jgi:uncharacterized lipoprotein YmbA
MHVHSALRIAVFLFLPLGLLGCGNDQPTRLYVLSATVPKPVATSPDGVAIGVGPVSLPKYLDRPQMVTGVSGNELSQANLDQRGGDLNDNITRVLATNLSNLLATDRVSFYPWKDGAPIDYQITLDVTQFQQDAAGNTVLSAFWSVVGKDGAVMAMRRSSYKSAGARPARPGPGNPAAAAPMTPPRAGPMRKSRTN